MPNGDSTDRNEILNVNIDRQKETWSLISDILSILSAIDPEPNTKIVLKLGGYIFQLVAVISPDPENQQDNALKAIAQYVEKAFYLLNAAQVAHEIETKFSDMQQTLKKTADTLENLDVEKNNPGTISPSTLILNCQEAVSHFLLDDPMVWYLTWNAYDFEKVCWDDSDQKSICYEIVAVSDGMDVILTWQPKADKACFGPQYPPKNADNKVFDYRVSLPAYLATVTAMCMVGQTFQEDFRKIIIETGYLTSVQSKLQWLYEKILNEGLTSLTPPNWSEGLTSSTPTWWNERARKLVGTACPCEGGEFLPRPPIELDYSFFRDPKMHPYPKSATIRYGAVEKFSGASSIGQAIVTDIDKANIAAFHKLQIRTLKRTKDLYISLGLRTVWQMINHLKVLAGDHSAPEREFSTWSFREVFQVAQLPAVNGGYSLRTLAAFLVQTQPYDTPYDPASPNTNLSFRQLLNDTP